MNDRWLTVARWGGCLAFVLCFHAAGAVAMLARWNDSPDFVANAPLITVELAAVPAAQDIVPNDAQPGPQHPEAQPVVEPEKSIEAVEIPPAPQSEPLPQAAPPPKPAESQKQKKPKQKLASLPSAPSTAAHRAERAAAPMPGAASHDPDAMPNWKSKLVAQIQRFKRYPADARGESGVADVAFNVDRNGSVHRKRIVRSSGSGALDRDALAWIERAQPLPPPPRGMSGAMISITVPLRYIYRQN